jgi:hypothetical protein
MSRLTWRRALFVVLVVAFAIPASAAGGKPEIFHSSFFDTEQDVEVCPGLIVDLVSRGVFTDKAFSDSQGNFIRFSSTASAKTTLTAANGKSVIIQNAGSFTDVNPLVDEEAGTITFVTTFKGLPEKIQTRHGPVLLRDAGVITFVDTFDLATDELISSDVIIKGPHPEAESDFEAFCQVITQALA